MTQSFLLDSFHTLNNLLGAIETLMEGSGLTYIVQRTAASRQVPAKGFRRYTSAGKSSISNDNDSS